MKKLNMLRTCRQARRLLRDHGPLVGIVTAGVGFTGSIISTVRATVKAVRHTDRVEDDRKRELTSKELIAENWRYYAAPVLLWAGSVASLCFAAKSHTKSIKSLAALYAASETARKNLEDSARKVLGEEKYEKLQEEVVENSMEDHPLKDASILDTGYGPFLFYDPLSGRYFRSSTAHVQAAINEFNNRINTQRCGLSYNDLFDYISPKFDEIEFGREVGWGPERGVADIRLKGRERLTENGESCIMMIYRKRPYEDFDF